MTRRITSWLLSVCIIVASFLISSCTSKVYKKYSAYSLDYFDTATTITGYAKSKEEFDRISGEILCELEEYHRLFTIYHRFEGFENLCTVNELQKGEHRTVKVDKKIIDLLLFSKEIYTLTEGKVNIAMGSVLSIWHEYRKAGLDDPANAELPSTDILEAAREHTDINNIIIDEQNCTVFLSDPQMTLDVGAVAKGYATEMVAKSLEQRGISGYVINVGGNVRTIGKKADGEKWLAGIENPDTDSDDSFIAYLSLAGESLVTSGSYQRFYIVDGKSYHHIIDNQTFYPAENFLSVSVVCKDSGLADGLSTALFCMTFDEGESLINSTEGAEAIWVLPDGTKKQSKGFNKYLIQKNLNDKCAQKENLYEKNSRT